jgi:hypothetical protein
MLSAFWPHLEIVGHSDLAGAATPGKVCPGELLSVDNIRYRALAINKSLCGQRLLDAGVIF